jgi:hypothetical protein
MNRLEPGAPAPAADPPPSPAPLHDDHYAHDFARWLRAQATLLRERKFDLLDVDNLAEEVEGMARREHRELRNRLKAILTHLLKCKFQPEHRSHNWLGTLLEQRDQVRGLIADSPSLQRHVAAYADDTYRAAAELAALETGLALSSFPQSNPFSPAELLDSNFIP